MLRKAGVRALAGAAVIDVISIDTPALGDRSYLATEGQVALVVEPQRDIGEVPPGEIWAHCRPGYRAAIVAALLQGLPLVTDDAAGRAA